VWVGSGGQKCFLTSVSPVRTDQRQSFPRPNPHRICGPILRMYRHVKVGVWGCVREIVCIVQACPSVFPKFTSTHHTNSGSKGTIGIGKKIKLSNGVLRLGNGGVAANLCLRNLLGHLRLRKE